MMECQKDMRIPEELLPVCPHCGKPMTMNLRSDGRFVQDEGAYGGRAVRGFPACQERAEDLVFGAGLNS